MKGQRYRFKLITLLLMGLILLSLVHGARTIPLESSSASLRDSILRLTGQATPSPEPEAVETPQLSGLGGEATSPTIGVEETFTPSPEPSEEPTATWTSPYDYPFLTPDASPTPMPTESASPVSQSLSEALSNYFDSK